MKTNFLTCGILALLCGAAPGFASTASICDAVAGNLVSNCGFELGNFGGWTVDNNDGNTAVESFGFNSMDPDSGNDFAALGDASSTPTTLEQTFNDVVGTSLTFSFYVSTDGSGGGLLADYDGNTLVALTNTTADGYTEYSFTVTPTGSDTISFIEEGPIGSYIGLDDVVVVDPPPPAATPEPTSIAFLALALGAVVFAHRRCSKKTA
jgi:hypothetical protein